MFLKFSLGDLNLTFILHICGVTIMLRVLSSQPKRTYFKPIKHVNISNTKDYESDDLKRHNRGRERCARLLEVS